MRHVSAADEQIVKFPVVHEKILLQKIVTQLECAGQSGREWSTNLLTQTISMAPGMMHASTHSTTNTFCKEPKDVTNAQIHMDAQSDRNGNKNNKVHMEKWLN